MWPFKSKDEAIKKKLGIDGNNFQITADELVYVNKMESLFEGNFIHPDFVDKFGHAVTAAGLSNYSMHKLDMFNLDGNKEHINHAIASAIKAYSIHQLPIYAYDIAEYSEQLGDLEKTKSYYLKFLEIQSKFIPDQLDEIFLASRNIEEAKHNAVNKI
jgi:hypothetical protein